MEMKPLSEADLDSLIRSYWMEAARERREYERMIEAERRRRERVINTLAGCVVVLISPFIVLAYIWQRFTK